MSNTSENFKDVTRVVVVSQNGREYDKKGFEGVNIHIQDEGRTLKVIDGLDQEAKSNDHIDDVLDATKPSHVDLHPKYYDPLRRELGIGLWEAKIWYGPTVHVKATATTPTEAIAEALSKGGERH